MDEEFAVTAEMLRKRPEMVQDGWYIGQRIKGRVLHAKYSRYMQRLATVAPALVAELSEKGGRFTHHSSIAPDRHDLAEPGQQRQQRHRAQLRAPVQPQRHPRRQEVEGKGRRVQPSSCSPTAPWSTRRPMPHAADDASRLPDYFISADDITPKAHVDIQAASQKWIDSSISKTANVPTDYPYEDFKDIYMYAHKQGLKGCTTFRFNPAAFQGVLVKETDLENTTYRFELEDGTVVEAKGNEEIEYDGELHSAANLFDALKEGYYGKF
jgi:ribonucleoside-diphosphate reductase alpha chain